MSASPQTASLRQLRQGAGLTQMALAAKIGAGAQQVASWEAGRTRPSIKYLQPLAAALGVTTDDVLGAVAPAPQDERA
ncbi:MAG TPA: helix-turn-helix transcriptional regulator [Actinomycetota bacterium]|jgi:transcriptional regulator with XRE-family HTH domain